MANENDGVWAGNSNNDEYPPEDTLGDQWLRAFGPDLKPSRPRSPSSAPEWYERVSKLAYQLYLRRGQVPGHELDDLFAAERIVTAQLSQNGPKGSDQSDGESTR